MADWMGIEIYSVLLVVVAVAFFYYYVSTLEWTEQERRRLFRAELNLSVILQLIEGSDVQGLMAGKVRSRRHLFRTYAKGMRQDVLSLLGWRNLTFSSIALICVFFVAYYVLKAKSWLFCGFRDVYFLSGLELSILRSLEQ